MYLFMHVTCGRYLALNTIHGLEHHTHPATLGPLLFTPSLFQCRPISPRRRPLSPPRRRLPSPPRDRQRRRTPTRRSPARRRSRSPAAKVSLMVAFSLLGCHTTRLVSACAISCSDDYFCMCAHRLTIINLAAFAFVVVLIVTQL